MFKLTKGLFSKNKDSLLLKPLKIGNYTVPNRIVMAAMTWMRCGPDGVPGKSQENYYS